MAISQADVVDYIKNLKLSEVKGLIEILEDELGVEASAPMMAMAAPAAGGDAAKGRRVSLPAVHLQAAWPSIVAMAPGVSQFFIWQARLAGPANCFFLSS